MSKRLTKVADRNQAALTESDEQLFDLMLAINFGWIQSAQVVLLGYGQMQSLQMTALNQIEDDMKKASVAVDHCKTLAENTQVTGRYSASAFQHLSDYWQKMFRLMLDTGSKLTEFTPAPLMLE